MRKSVLLLIIIPTLLTGCWDLKIFEQVDFTLQLGIESSKKEGELLITGTSPAIGAKEKMAIEMISSTAQSLREATEKRNRMAAKRTRSGKIQQILFSEEIAGKGIHELLEVFERDPEDPLLAWVAVVEGSPREMFEKASKFKDIPGPALYINQLLQHSSKDAHIPVTRVYNFDVNYFAPGIDPVTPLLRLVKEDILVVGSALFSDDKMVGKIDHKQTALLLAMMGKTQKTVTSYITSQPPGESPEAKEYIAITLSQCKRKIDVYIKDKKPVVNINISYSGYLEEFGWDNFSDQSVQKKVEKHIAGNIKKDCMELLKYMQEVGSDPIGIGDMVRAKYYSYWQSIDWKEVYKEAQINVDVQVDIKEYGAID